MRCSLINSAKTGFGSPLLEILPFHIICYAKQMFLFSDYTKKISYFVFIISNVITYYPLIKQPINKFQSN